MVIPVGSTSLSGLGCGCSETDPDTGDCLDPDPCGSNSGTITLPGFGTPPPVGPGACTTPECIYGGLPTSTPISPGSATSTNLSPQQYALYAAILNNAGAIGKELAITPGTVVTPQGGVSQQNPGYPIGGTGFSSAIGGSMSSLMPIAILAIGAIVLMQAGKR